MDWFTRYCVIRLFGEKEPKVAVKDYKTEAEYLSEIGIMASAFEHEADAIREARRLSRRLNQEFVHPQQLTQKMLVSHYEVFNAAKKVCVNDCSASFPGCSKCKNLFPQIGKEQTCPLAKYCVPVEENPKPWYELSADERLSLYDLYTLCSCCTHAEIQADGTVKRNDTAFFEICLDCPVKSCEDNILENEAEARMS